MIKKRLSAKTNNPCSSRKMTLLRTAANYAQVRGSHEKKIVWSGNMDSQS